MRTETLTSGLKILGLALFVASCGQDPSFLDKSQSNATNGIDDAATTDDSENSDDATAESRGGILNDVTGGKSNTIDDTAQNGGSSSNNGSSGGNGSSGTTPGMDPEDYVIPGVTPDERNSINRCMKKWGQLPFSNTIQVRKVYASVTVGGFGNAINDTVRTPNPELVLVYAGVNVGGNPNYNLLNPNGYYCMLVNVNVNTDLDINLHCNARLADSIVSVNVGSTVDGATSAIGVNVNSSVEIHSVRPSGDTCVR